MGPSELTDEQRELVVEHMEYARKGAKKYLRISRDMGYTLASDYDEYLSAAYMGLVVAAAHYTPGRAKFTTYSFQWINRYLLRVLQVDRRANGWAWNPNKQEKAEGKKGMQQMMQRDEWPRHSNGRDDESRLPSYRPFESAKAVAAADWKGRD